MNSIKTYDKLLQSLTKEELLEVYEKSIGKNNEQIKELFKEYNLDIDDELINELNKRFEGVEQLSMEELDYVSGGTCYRSGWDGQYRPVVTVFNLCQHYEPPYARGGGSECCESCKYYSYNVNGIRISLMSAYCTNKYRIKGHDDINP